MSFVVQTLAMEVQVALAARVAAGEEVEKRTARLMGLARQAPWTISLMDRSMRINLLTLSW